MDPRNVRKLNILLAVDGSEHALAAARLLNDLPLTEDSTITVAAALVPRDAANHATLESALEQTRAILVSQDIQIETQLLTGSPPEVLIEFADQHSPDLIVLGARGRRATLGILLGGTVQQIVEYATWPVLVVRAPYAGLRRILLIVDGSEYGQRALRYLGKFPLRVDTQVRLMHVLPPVPSPALVARSWPIGTEAVAPIPSYETEALLSKQAEDEEKEGRALLERACKELQEAGLQANTVLLRGDAATEIIGYVKAHQIDLIVAGSRGLSPMKRLLLGSLSRKLIHYAGCSVLIVRGGNHVLD